MYCKNCGSEIDDGAAICVHCGVKAGSGNKFCSNCGAEAEPHQSACLKCGSSLSSIPQGAVQKSRLAAGLFGILLGGFGVHSFYLGYVGKGVAQILLSFCCGVGYIWGLIEGILILTGSINTDAEGIPLKDDKF